MLLPRYRHCSGKKYFFNWKWKESLCVPFFCVNISCYNVNTCGLSTSVAYIRTIFSFYPSFYPGALNTLEITVFQLLCGCLFQCPITTIWLVTNWATININKDGWLDKGHQNFQLVTQVLPFCARVARVCTAELQYHASPYLPSIHSSTNSWAELSHQSKDFILDLNNIKSKILGGII